MTLDAGGQAIDISARDIDSLSVLPLAILPLETEALRRIRMIKDSRLESAIEIFSGESVGSGLIYLSNLRETFPRVTLDDCDMLAAVAELHSFDVYSLRISLRNIGIEVDAQKHLCLSEAKQRELQEYIRPFTERLIKQIYGGTEANVDTTTIATLFHDPDVNAAREKLRNIARNLSIPLQDVPQFLADYGDIYLSVAYYRNCLDSVQPVIDDFLATLDEIKQHREMMQNQELMKVCKHLEGKLGNMKTLLTSRFDTFTSNTDDMWQDMNAERFGNFRQMVEDSHSVLGGLLCVLSIKMTVWSDNFPLHSMAGPSRRADFIMTEMRQGLLN